MGDSGKGYRFYYLLFLGLCWELTAVVVHMGGIWNQERADRNELKVSSFGGFENQGQSLRGVFCTGVQQKDGAGLKLGRNTVGDLLCGQTAPVQRVQIPLDGNTAAGMDALDDGIVV